MNTETIESILGRKEFNLIETVYDEEFYANKKILITGANGSIGTRFQKVLKCLGIDFCATDIEGNLPYLDVTDFQSCFSIIHKYRPDFIVNLAGFKYATKSKHQCVRTVQVNVDGVRNLISASPAGTRVILTSTCKSCNPETVYGATKLIAERMVMNSGGSVARFFSVIQTEGNVFEIWKNLPETAPLQVVEECERYFVSVDEACGLILYSIMHRGRFTINSGSPRNMKEIADDVYPDRMKVYAYRRRGDRKTELFKATSERKVHELHGSVIRLIGDNDRKKNFIE